MYLDTKEAAGADVTIERQPGPVEAKLIRALKRLKRGWVQGDLYEDRTGRVCALGAISVAYGHRPFYEDDYVADEPLSDKVSLNKVAMTPEAQLVFEALPCRYREPGETAYAAAIYCYNDAQETTKKAAAIYCFNDAQETTKKNVVSVFEKAIASARKKGI